MRLTMREQETLVALVECTECTEAMAERLGITRAAVYLRLNRMYKKTGTTNRIQLMRWAFRAARRTIDKERRMEKRRYMTETDQFRKSVSQTEAIELLVCYGNAFKLLIAERDDLAAKLEATNVELHELRIKAGMANGEALCRYFQSPEHQHGEAWITIYRSGELWQAELYDSVDCWVAGESEPVAEANAATIAAAVGALMIPEVQP